jgi:hypothetical protein
MCSSRRAEEQKSRGAEEQRSRRAEEQRSRRAEERKNGKNGGTGEALYRLCPALPFLHTSVPPELPLFRSAALPLCRSF